MMLALYSIEILEAKRMLRQRIRFRFERKYSGNPEWGGWIGGIKI